MKKLNLLLLFLLALPLGMLADEMRDSLPSNYGNWLNLTNGYTEDKGGNHQKMEVAIDGNTIHLSWVEFTKQTDNTYNVWYRRSLDLGKTWEDAKVVYKARTDQILNINSGAANRYMVVNNGHIHMAFVNNKTNDDERSHLVYLRSNDGGATFTSQILGLRESRYDWYAGSIIASDGDLVVIGASSDDDSKVHYFTSKDCGETFTTQVQTLEHNSRTAHFYDLQASNGRWASMTYGQYWYYNLQYGYLYMTVSDGETMTSQNIAPLHSDDTPYAIPDVMVGGNGSSYNYHPQMVMDGNTIHVMYKGNPGGKEEKSDYNYTLYQKSVDGGKTWSKATVLPQSNGTHGTIAAKGDNVYILSSTTSGERVVYFSHDGGTSWGIQNQCTWTERNSNNPTYSYSFAFDPNDKTGNHVYLTGNRFYYIETKDGFKSICKNFVLGGEALIGHPNNYALTLLQDKNDTQHWFLQYQKPYVNENGNADTEKSSRDICYLRVEPKSEPAPSGTKALNLTDYKMIDRRVVIPMSTSLLLKDAMTVEAWVRIDSLCTFQIAGTTQVTTHESSQYNGGWYIKATDWYKDGGYFEAGIRTDQAIDGNGVRIYNQDAVRFYNMERWHHVALTYDAKGGENNARLYIDGMLAAAQTVTGGILASSNPIALGMASQYGAKGLLDHFAIFNKALTEAELREHIYHMPTGQEDGCVCLLNFDGTLKDMSGHDNNGVALLDADFVEHDGIRPPKASFGVAKDIRGKNISMIDQTESGEAVWWYIDKGEKYYTRYVTSTSKHPSLNNLDPGNIVINMLACNDNAYAAITNIATIAGLNRIEPRSAGQNEVVSLRIVGGYKLNKNNKPAVKLRQGSTVIEGSWVMDDDYDSEKVVSTNELAYAVFNLSNAPLGKYDVVVNEDALPEAFELEAAEEPNVWMEINGWDKMLKKRWKNFSIDYGNSSNVDAYNVPVYIFVPENIPGTIGENGKPVDKEDEYFVSFDFDFDVINKDLEDMLEPEAVKWGKNELGEYQTFKDPRGGGNYRCYSFMIPYIPAHGEGHKGMRLKYEFTKLPNNGIEKEVQVVYMIGQPWGPFIDDNATTRGTRAGGKGMSRETAECLLEYLATGVVDATAAAIPFGGCVWGAGKTIYQGFSPNTKDRWSTLATNLFTTGFSCVMDANPLGWGWRACQLANIAFSTAMNIWSAKGCQDGDGKDKKIKILNSYDPNEMIGPSGYDDNAHYIKPIHNMSYTITYENKSTATAPAHEVYVSNKLDLSKFDAETFGFTSFGWADTTIYVGGSMTKEFTRDIKYKVKNQDIIVRVTGAFDEATGAANWSMISLDKNGKEIEDPEIGYLLPNNDDHVGEGFVTYTICHKPTPANGSTISNKATIVFDANEPIETNTFVNTFDTDYPTSKITAVERSGDKMTVKFEGSDATSGIDSYDLYAFKNGGEAELLAGGITTNQYQFETEANTTYALCVIARDHVGWMEPKDLKPEYLPGDANGDGAIDNKDIDTIVHYILTGDTKNFVFMNADVNGDQKVNVADIVLIIH